MFHSKPVSFQTKSALLHLGLVLATVISGLGITPVFHVPVFAVDGCATPTTITGGGSYALVVGDNCFKYVNTAFSKGAMWSVMNGSDSTVSNVLKWYGGRNETVTNCINDSQTLNGNGAQLNNFTVAKDSGSAMYVSINANKANTVSMTIQNWQNGTGCSVAPTPISGGGPTNTPTNTSAAPTNTPTRTNTPTGPTNTPTRTNTPAPPTNTPTRTNTPSGPTNTPTRTNTPVPPTNTPTRTNTPVGPTNTPTSGNVPWLSVSGRFIKDPGNNTVILRGVSLIDTWVADTRTGKSAIALTNMASDNAAGWYARVVRFPVYPNAIDFTPGWIADPDAYFNNHLDPAIQNCVSRGLYCVIDWHYITDYNNSTVDTATRNFWNYVAPRYANTPNVIYELYNEPVNPDNWSTWKTWAQPWVNIIRSHAPNNLILIGGPRWSQNVAEAATNPFTGSNLVYVAHIYPQHGGQSTWDSWFGNSSATVPYFISEWGWQNGGATPTSGTYSGYGAPFSAYLDSKGVSWTAWVFDNIWQPIMFDANWNLLGGEDYMGQFTKDFLFQHRNDNQPGGGGPTATPTNTSSAPTNTPTRTNTPTGATNTPTNTPVPGPTNTPASGSLKVQHKQASTSTSDGEIKPHLRIHNTGGSSVTLSTLKMRYWYTRDTAQPQTINCDYAFVGCGNVTFAFVQITPVTGADFYLEVGFTSGAGSVAAGGNSGEIQARFNKNDWSAYNELDDWSYAANAAFADNSKVTLYQSGSLVWGSEPGGGGPTNTPGGPTNTPTNTPAGPTNTPTNTPVGPTNTPTNTPIGPTPTKTNTPVPGTHLSNPFAGATWYVNPDWAASVNASGVTASQKALVSSQNTAVWLDSRGTLNGTNGARSLLGHLDHAVATGKNLIIIVVYNLPGRDCSALASNGELPGTAAGLATYKTEYIDVIYNNIASKPAYANLRIVAVIEPDSLPNLVTNLSDPDCASVNSNGYYVQGIQYAINRLHSFSNVYLYLDIGHAGWLGWPSNFGPAITLYKNTIKGTTAGGSSVDGFVDNTANNQVQTEPYMTANQMISGNPVRSAFFFSWNDYIQEDTFDAAWKAAMTSGTDAIPASSANMLIDTARNGWGGCGGSQYVSQPCRPTGPSTSTALETFVNQSRIDRRPAKGDWCNQNGAGIGERPTANPNNPVYQAFIWVKPPGESDGSSELIPQGPDNPDGKGFDRMCDPTYMGNSLNQNMNTNALPNAPVSGRWFEAQFQQLVANAYPPIP